MTDGKLPLGILKQAVMKLDSANTDIKDAMADEDLTPDDTEALSQISEVLQNTEAFLYSIVSKEMDEDEFANEDVDMDEISEFPESNILDTNV